MASVSRRWKWQALAGVLLVVPAVPGLAQSVQTQGDQSPAVNAGGNVTITYNRMSEEEKEAFAKQITDKLLAAMKGSGPPQVGLNGERRVSEAVTAIAKGASEGDPRLQQAFSLLAAGNVAQATPLLQAVAEEKTARIRQDSEEAATAYRNLGAIAGLRDPTKALNAYAKAAALDPDDVESLFWAGYLEVDHGELSSAETRLKRVLTLTPEQDWHHYWSQLRLGDIEVQRGNLPAALKSYRDGQAIAERLAKADPANAGWQRDLSVSFNKVGDVLVAQGNLAEALKSYRDGLAIAERLAKADPGNAGWQYDLGISNERIGDVLVAQGNLAEALNSYRAKFAIIERLAKADPANAGWQRDLSVSFEKVGDVLVAQGNLAEALKSYRDGLTIRDRLAKADPGNAGWQRDLSVSFEKVGDVLVAQGNLAEALKSYRDGLAIAERLAKADPGNAGWQRDLAICYGQVAIVEARQAAHTEALKEFRRGRDIIERLSQQSPDNATLRNDLKWFEDQVANQ
jgi:tetratricopeptide (TPR) repeat protein